jgi:hypothetical protein
MMLPMGSIVWGRDVAEVYDKTYRAMFEPSVLDPVVDLLAELAGDGPAVEFAVGTGRVALALSARGVPVHGVELSTQDDQLAVFANAAAHLEPGGCFVVDVIVPQLRRVPPGETARVFTLEPGHVGIETFDDLVGQITWSHHWVDAGGRLVHHAAPYRFVWPSELDLMARIAGFRLRDRWADWDRAPFTSGSDSQVAVFEKLPAQGG